MKEACGVVGIVAPGLPGQVEATIRARVVPGPGDPLPVSRVVGHVSIDQPSEEVSGTESPVDAQLFHEERRRQHAGAVVHETLGQQLPHACVDNRQPGAPIPPRVEGGSVTTPSPSSRPVITGGQRREGCQNLNVEVTPAQLSHERLVIGGTLCQLERGDAAEVEVGAETGRAVARHVVVAAGVLREKPAHEGGRPGAADRLAATGAVRRQRA